ncbi:MAG: patatin-like phospholipase family protein, partial [Alphaproteobacteria bacterium]
MRILRKRDHPRPISLALQGGGAHGAFIWGVLDRLLEDERLVIDGISGTSSGAINAALVADGMAADGRAGAKAQLERFWRRVSEACESRRRRRFALPLPAKRKTPNLSTAAMFYKIMHRLLLPYKFNAITMDPLRGAIADTIDFHRLRASTEIKVFVNATDVRAITMRVFENHELDADVICASSCLPFLFLPVEIEGAHYWDGSFMGNPALYPLVYDCRANDIVLVQTSPFGTQKLPKTAPEIIERITELSFASTLVRELRAIEHLNELVDAGGIRRRAGLRRTNMHTISAASEMECFQATSKFRADWRFFEELHEIGRQAADAWLDRNFDRIGVASTADLLDDPNRPLRFRAAAK